MPPRASLAREFTAAREAGPRLAAGLRRLGGPRRWSAAALRGARRRARCRVMLVLALAGGVPADVSVGEMRPAAQVGADALHEAGLTGSGVTVAVVGFGEALAPGVRRAAAGHDRLLAVLDARSAAGRRGGVAVGRTSAAGPSEPLTVMLSSLRDPADRYLGVAPNADLVLLTALDPSGLGRPDDVVAAVEWAVANRDRYGIRVLQLPLAGAARARWWEDPVSLAAAEAWRAGIVVVAAAGDGGPAPATIAAPGDVPEIITVGASGHGAAGVAIAPCSAAGPTLAGYAKPELVAPGGPPTGPCVSPAPGAVQALTGGTAIAAAAVSGVVALLLEASPWLTPNEVKDRLLHTARPLSPPADLLAVLRQGAGSVDARSALTGEWTPGPGPRNAGNAGASWDSGTLGDDGSISGLRGYTWSDHALRGYTWSDNALRGYTWSDRALRGPDGSDRAVRGMTWSD